MRHISLPLSNGLMTRSELEPTFLRMDLCYEVRLDLVTCGGELAIRFRVCLRKSVRLVEFDSGGTQAEGLQYVGRLVVRGWLLRLNPGA